MQWLMMALALGTAAAAQAEPGENPPQRIRNITLTKTEKCPAAEPGEVVVCHTLEDPYRIPAPLRRSKIAMATTSWVNRAAVIDEVSRVAGGLPSTCSVVSTGGQTGCTQQMIRRWAAERKAAKAGELP